MRLYVGNLPWSATEEDIQEAFGVFGEITNIYMPTDRETGRFRGFAFVEMDRNDAENAITGLDGKDLGGRALKVNEARERENRGGGGRESRHQQPNRGMNPYG
jgi:RNA recognition motif-containing protein